MIAVIWHWKEIVATADERIKLMSELLKIMKVEVSKIEQLGVALAKSRELATKLQIDIDNHVSSLFAKSEENEALNT